MTHLLVVDGSWYYADDLNTTVKRAMWFNCFMQCAGGSYLLVDEALRYVSYMWYVLLVMAGRGTTAAAVASLLLVSSGWFLDGHTLIILRWQAAGVVSLLSSLSWMCWYELPLMCKLVRRLFFPGTGG